MEVDLTSSFRSVWREAMSLLQQLDGMLYMRQVQVQAHLHEVRRSPPHGRQSLIIFYVIIAELNS